MSSSPATGFFSELSPEHAKLLIDSAISEQVAVSRGYRSTERKCELKELGFSQSQQRTPALIIPIWNTQGETVNYQIRPNRPRVQKRPDKADKPVKYESVQERRACLDIPNDANVRKALRSLVPLFITEGARKVDAMITLGLLTIGLLGVWGYRGSNELGGLTSISEWENINLKRLIYLVFDSDMRTSIHVVAALRRFKSFLEGRGAEVRIIWLRFADDGSKMGADDFIADRKKAGKSDDEVKQELLSLASDELPQIEGAGIDIPYKATERGLVWMKEIGGGLIAIQLTNFNARIVSETVEDDGQETKRLFTVEASLDGDLRRFEVPANQFTGSTMRWVVAELGVSAVVYPGKEEHTRCAIQLLSAGVQKCSVYTHTGWREIEGRWLYLHSGGAIGEQGAVPAINVRLNGELTRLALPEPPRGERLRRAIRASLNMREVAGRLITYPLHATVYRAVLGNCDYSVGLIGETGAGKTEVAALLQQHFGPTLDARHLPASWSSTGNALEAVAFAAKDALLVVDDFVPASSTGSDAQRQQRDADRLLRGQGNRSGRQRLWADGTLRSTKYPRGLVLSTGEDMPNGQSLRSRLLTLEVDKRDGANSVHWEKLTIAQSNASGGLYAEAMSGFLQFIAPRYGDVQKELRDLIGRLKELATQGDTHRRLPEIVANLTCGLIYFLRFAITSEAMSEQEAEEVLVEGWRAFGQAALAQSHHQNASEATGLFRKLLSAAIASGAAHVALDDGEPPILTCRNGPPLTPRTWGWREAGTANWQAQGKRVGWISKDTVELLLQPEAAFAVARRFGEDTNESLNITRVTLNKRLHERGLLVGTDKAREVLTVRKTVEGKRLDVLHVPLGFLGEISNDKNPDHPDRIETNRTDVRDSLVEFLKSVLKPLHVRETSSP